MLPNIYICGKAGAGKSTLANVLVAEYGYRRVALADGVKRGIDVAGNKYKTSLYADDLFPNETDCATTCKVLLEKIGWGMLQGITDCKETYREFMQWWGTTIVRALNENTWINYLTHHTPYGAPIVCDDVRFSNEEKYFFYNKWCGINIIRPDHDNGIPAEQAAHESEQYIPQHCTMTIYNYNDCLADFKDHCLASLAEHFNDTHANILTGKKSAD